MQKEFQGKNILITGGTGSIGSELVKQVLEYHPKKIRIFSRDETKQYELMEKIGRPENVLPLVGDVRDKERLNFAFRDVDIVLHAAAMKHVSIGEYNPFEVVKTNIVGSQNVVDAAILQGVKKVIGISTDKAVNPTNVLGISKLMMEKLFVNANYYTKRTVAKFSCVRFGNVAWSRGSVLPSWKQQADARGTIEVTNGKMTRFFMSKKQAITLVLRAALLTQGGEIFVLKMPSVELMDLARIFVEKYYPNKDIQIEETGERDGEKTHESLVDDVGQYEKIFSDEEMYIFIPRMKLRGMEGFLQEIPAYKGFHETPVSAGTSSMDALHNGDISDIV